MPTLIRQAAPGVPEERFELKRGQNSLGRARENDIIVVHGSLSRQHARVDVAFDGVSVTDLGSRNGTFVDGLRVLNCKLKNGDSVQFGEVPFKFVDELPSQAKSAKGVAGLDPRLSSLLGQGKEIDSTTAIKLSSLIPVDRSEAKLRILLSVSDVLSSPEPVEDLLPKIVDLLFEILDVDRAALLLAQEGRGLAPEIARTRNGPSRTGAFYSTAIVEHVFKRGAGLLSADATVDPRFADSLSVAATMIRSSMAVPLKGRDEVLGVLYVDHLSIPNRYGPEDLEFVSAFAAQAATAIENARLYRKLEAEAVRRTSLLRFFPPAVLGPLLSSPGFGSTVKDADVTVLFSDISGFTAMSSSLAPREVVELLNRYFPVMAEIVFRHEGTLEKYIGDALMAIWGVPVPHDDDADRAVRAALEMREALQILNAGLPAERKLQIHVGLNSGPVAFGNIGSPDYVQFAAIGDTTNVASRVCTAAQPGEVLVSEATWARMKSQDFRFESLPPVAVKGKVEPLCLYRVSRAGHSLLETGTVPVVRGTR